MHRIARAQILLTFLIILLDNSPSPALVNCTTLKSTSFPSHHSTRVISKAPVKKDKCKVDKKNEAPGLIKEATLDKDYKEISKIFSTYCGTSNLAKGFDYEGDLEKLLKPTSDREHDPDIISFKGFAYHAITVGEYERLAEIFLYALFGDSNI